VKTADRLPFGESEGSSATSGFPKGAEIEPGLDDAPLVADGISVHYGGVHALSDVHLRVDDGEIVGLIGGNGAGKTTFMDCVSGYVSPERGGTLSAFGEDVGALAPELRPYLGIVRSFQNAHLYPQLSVDEALLVAVERHRPSGLLSSLIASKASRLAEAEKREWVDELVARLGLEPYRSKRIGELSTGTRRVVDLATTMAQRPKLILFDEPTTGLAQRETEAFGPLLVWLRDALACAVLIIEHDMPLITSVADRLYALEAGRVIAEGAPSDVIADARVIASYLGYDEAAIRRSGRATSARSRAGGTRSGNSTHASRRQGTPKGRRTRARPGSGSRTHATRRQDPPKRRRAR
jgi:ABC-type branched-subunit amino acid transport system ATPase component